MSDDALQYAARKKSLGIALALWFFLGAIGVHRLYLRSYLGWILTSLFIWSCAIIGFFVVTALLLSGDVKAVIGASVAVGLLFAVAQISEIAWIIGRTESLNRDLVCELAGRPPIAAPATIRGPALALGTLAVLVLVTYEAVQKRMPAAELHSGSTNGNASTSAGRLPQRANPTAQAGVTSTDESTRKNAQPKKHGKKRRVKEPMLASPLDDENP